MIILCHWSSIFLFCSFSAKKHYNFHEYKFHVSLGERSKLIVSTPPLLLQSIRKRFSIRKDEQCHLLWHLEEINDFVDYESSIYDQLLPAINRIVVQTRTSEARPAKDTMDDECTTGIECDKNPKQPKHQSPRKILLKRYFYLQSNIMYLFFQKLYLNANLFYRTCVLYVYKCVCMCDLIAYDFKTTSS